MVIWGIRKDDSLRENVLHGLISRNKLTVLFYDVLNDLEIVLLNLVVEERLTLHIYFLGQYPRKPWLVQIGALFFILTSIICRFRICSATSVKNMMFV